MTIRIRAGNFTFGRSGTRLSLWRNGSGVSVPMSGKGRAFGKVRAGPVSWYLNEGGGKRRPRPSHKGVIESAGDTLQSITGLVFILSALWISADIIAPVWTYWNITIPIMRFFDLR